MPPFAPGAAASADAATEPVATAGGLDAAAVRRVWDDVLGAVRARSRPTQALLAEVSVAQVSGRTLTLAFRHAPLMRQFQGRAGVDVVKEALQEVLGADLDVVCTTGTDGPAASESKTGGPRGAAPAAVHEGFAPGDEAVAEDPDARPAGPQVRGDDAALRLVQQELGGRVVGTVGEE